MALTKKIATAFYFTQTDPATTWTVVHNLGSYPAPDVFVDVSGSLVKIIPMSITYVDENTCVVEFSSPRTGKVIIS